MRKLLITLAICLVIGGVAHATPTAGVNTPPTVYGTCMGYQPGIGGDFCLNNGAQSFWQQFTGDVKNIRGTPQCSPTNTTQCGKLTVQGLNGIPLVGSLGDNQFWCFNLASGNMVPCTGGGGGGGGPINTLPAQTGDYDAHGFRLTDVGVGTTIGDTLEFGLNHLNDLAPATGVYSMNGNKIQGLAAATVTNDAIAYGQAAAYLISATIDAATINGVISVTAPPYNCKGDGTTDDYACLQAAIYAASNTTNPPTGTPLLTATRPLYLPAVYPHCYLHSKPLRVPAELFDIEGENRFSALCQNYIGPSIIFESWGQTNLSTSFDASLATGPGASLHVNRGQIAKNIDLARFMNAQGSNNLAAKWATHGSLAWFDKPLALTPGDDGQVIGSRQAYPGTGNGAFKVNINGTTGIETALVNVVSTGQITVGSCPAESVGTTYFHALDWDGTTYRFWQAIPGSPATLCGSNANSNHIVQGVFETMLLAGGGTNQFWPDQSSVNFDAFQGDIDSVDFETVSNYSAGFTAPTTKFTAGANTYYLQNFETANNVDDTQAGYTFSGAQMYSVVLGGNNVGYVSGSTVKNLEFCASHSGGGVDGPWFSDMNNSTFDSLYCSNPYFSGMDFYRQDFLTNVSNITVSPSAQVGLVKGTQFTASLITNVQTDGSSVGEVAVGGGGGQYQEEHSHVVDRGGLVYAWIEDQNGMTNKWPFVDQETANTVFITNFLFEQPTGPTIVTGGNVDTRNSAPYMIKTGNNSVGPVFNGTVFNTFGASTPAPEIVDYTGTPTKLSAYVVLNNVNIPTGTSGSTIKVPLSNLAPQTVIYNNSTYSPLLNDTSTGTGFNLLVKGVTASSKLTAITLATTDVGTLGICIDSCGTSGAAIVQNIGPAGCQFDATSVVAGDYVQISSATAGDCHDSGVSSYTSNPPSGFIVGVALETAAGSAVRSVNLAFASTPSILANYGHITNITNAASPYSVLGTDYFISCNATAGATTITLPLATATGRQLIIKKSDSSANACTISRQSSDLIDGATTAVDAAQYQSFSVMDAGSAVWSIF